MAAPSSSGNPSSQHIDDLLSLIVDDRGFVAESDRDFVFRRLRSKLENRQCFDCHNRNPTWLSMTYAVFICLTCSGNHRRMGTHISFVRSCELDKFTRDQLIRMELGGNGRALTFFKSHGSAKPDFYSKLATKYRSILDKACQQVAANRDGGGLAELYASPPLDSNPSGQPQNTITVVSHQQQIPTTVTAPVPSESALASSTSTKPSSAVYASRVPPRYYDFNSSKSKNTLGSALMAHAAVTGGLGGSRASAKAIKLDEEFDFDGALEEAATVALTPVTFQPPPVVSYSGSPAPPVINLYTTAFSDATAGLSPMLTGYGGSSSFCNASPSRSPQQHHDGSSCVAASSVASNNRYAKAKAISSADLFAELKSPPENTTAERLEINEKFRRFNDCKSISSEAFHSGEPSMLIGTKSTAYDDASHLGAQARQGIQCLANGAQHTVAKARDWFNNFVFEEKRGNSVLR